MPVGNGFIVFHRHAPSSGAEGDLEWLGSMVEQVPLGEHRTEEREIYASCLFDRRFLLWLRR